MDDVRKSIFKVGLSTFSPKRLQGKCSSSTSCMGINNSSVYIPRLKAIIVCEGMSITGFDN